MAYIATLFKLSSPALAGFFICGMMGRFGAIKVGEVIMNKKIIDYQILFESAAFKLKESVVNNMKRVENE